MQREGIKSALIQLIEDGSIAVEGGTIHFDGEPLVVDSGGEYRPDGWSKETSYGCRRHRAIDEFIDKLSRGDEFERLVANEADVWFCFNPTEAQHLVADDEIEAKQALRAYWNSNIMARWLGAGSKRDDAFDYRLAADNWENLDAEGYWFMPPAHKVIYAMNPEGEAPDRWPDQYIADLKAKVDYHRSGDAERDQAWLR